MDRQLCQWLESEFFSKESLTIRPQNASSGYAHRCDRQPPLWIEHIVERIREQLLPLFDRSNRVMIRNLKALQARQDGSAPSVSIGSAGQVNVAQAQVNANGRTQADEAADDKTG